MEYFSIGCFGKLPIYPDFIRLNASSIEVQQLDRWFQEGIHFSRSRLGRDWERDFSKADPWNFVFSPEGSSNFLIGGYIPSQDREGRHYPFFLFLRVEKAAFEVPVYFAPLTFTLFLSRCREMLQADWSGIDLKVFLSDLKLITVAPSEDSVRVQKAYLCQLQDQTISSFWTDLLGDFGHPRKYLLLQSLYDLLQPLKNQPLNKFGLGLKFPLVLMDLKECCDIPFWFELSFRLLGKENGAPVFFWNRNTSKGSPCMLAFFSQPSFKNLLFLIRPDMDGDCWYDLAPLDGRNDRKIMDKVPNALRDLLENRELSLSAFLKAVEGIG